jgi:hypothetical protein
MLGETSLYFIVTWVIAQGLVIALIALTMIVAIALKTAAGQHHESKSATPGELHIYRGKAKLLALHSGQIGSGLTRIRLSGEQEKGGRQSGL